MTAEIDALKEMNLVDFLTQHYHMEFRHIGGEYVCRSPFTEDKRASFFVRLVDGHWLFKDFSSGLGGSIFDFVQAKENLERFSGVLSYIHGLVSPLSTSSSHPGRSVKDSDGAFPLEADSSSPPQRSYDVKRLYDQFKGEDISVCQDYLLGRGISKGLVSELIKEDILVHNRYKGHSYCCFAVFNRKRELKCLDNHQVDGSGKFVLGTKSVFTREWEELPRAKAVFVCEGIIDYLSIKTLEEDAPPGLALLGNDVSLDPALLGSARQIISALDYDRGGYSALFDVGEQFPEREIKIYDLEDHKDPNEFLMAVRSFKGRKLSPERKLKLYQEFLQSSNKSELARKWGMDRSYMYDIVGDCEKNILDSFSGRKPGRKPEGRPATLDAAWKRIEELENNYEREATERELLYSRSEFLKLRLKWAEIEAAELRGEPVDESKGPVKKKQIKKKKKKRS